MLAAFFFVSSHLDVPLPTYTLRAHIDCSCGYGGICFALRSRAFYFFFLFFLVSVSSSTFFFLFLFLCSSWVLLPLSENQAFMGVQRMGVCVCPICYGGEGGEWDRQRTIVFREGLQLRPLEMCKVCCSGLGGYVLSLSESVV